MKGPNANLVLVEWVDSCSNASVWSQVGDLPDEPKTCFTVGWVIENNRKHIQLASSAGLADDDSFDAVSGDMTIPKGCVVRVKTLSRRRL